MQINIDLSINAIKKMFGIGNNPGKPKMENPAPTPQAMYGNPYARERAYVAAFDGQNSLGEMGPPVNYAVDYDTLVLRSWQLYLESNNYKTILKKLKDTVIGNGLTLQCNPKVKYLERKGIKIDLEVFNEDLEEMWEIYSKSTMADYANRCTLGEIHARAYLNSVAAGTVLVILRPINNVVTVQLIDGIHLQTPISFGFASENKIGYEAIERINPETNNRVRWGIEIDATGKHVAYHVRVGYGLAYERVLAHGPKTGNLMAYILTDEEFRIDNLKGLPRLSSGMETASQLSRYKSAMVSAAEEIAKSPYYIYHKENTDDADPRLNNLTKAYDVDKPNNQLDYSAEGKAIANTVSVSTNRTVVNGTPGMELRALESKNALHFEPFNKAIVEEQAALAGIPPEIVASKFDSNFSASRAAFLAEGMRLNREWTQQGNHFLQPIFNLQLDIWVQMFEITAPGYLEALQTKNIYILNAYRNCTWKGQKMGHIDPLKEALYWRTVLGSGSGHLPMGDFKQAAEGLDLGDFAANLSQYAKEMKDGDALGIEHEDKLTDNNEEGGADDGTKKPPKKKTKQAKAFWENMAAMAQMLSAEE